MDNELFILHGRFAANGSVSEMGGRPDGLTAQQWFNFLCEKASDAYQTLAGARIVFKLTPERLESLKRAAVLATA